MARERASAKRGNHHLKFLKWLIGEKLTGPLHPIQRALLMCCCISLLFSCVWISDIVHLGFLKDEPWKENAVAHCSVVFESVGGLSFGFVFLFTAWRLTVYSPKADGQEAENEKLIDRIKEKAHIVSRPDHLCREFAGRVKEHVLRMQRILQKIDVQKGELEKGVYWDLAYQMAHNLHRLRRPAQDHLKEPHRFSSDREKVPNEETFMDLVQLVTGNGMGSQRRGLRCCFTCWSSGPTSQERQPEFFVSQPLLKVLQGQKDVKPEAVESDGPCSCPDGYWHSGILWSLLLGIFASLLLLFYYVYQAHFLIDLLDRKACDTEEMSCKFALGRKTFGCVALTCQMACLCYLVYNLRHIDEYVEAWLEGLELTDISDTLDMLELEVESGAHPEAQKGFHSVIERMDQSLLDQKRLITTFYDDGFGEGLALWKFERLAADLADALQPHGDGDGASCGCFGETQQQRGLPRLSRVVREGA